MFDKFAGASAGYDPSFEEVKALELEPAAKAKAPEPEEPADWDS